MRPSPSSWLSAVLFAANAALAQQTGFVPFEIPYGEGAHAKSVVWVPEDYDAARRWPLVLFLHGMGERGDDGERQTRVGIGKAIRAHPERFPCLVLMPQCPRDRVWTRLPFGRLARYPEAVQIVEGALQHVLRNYSVDPHRISLTGLSMGGFGAFALGARYPERFAAIVPVCGGGDPQWAEALARVPMWVHHGAEDRVVPARASRRMVEAIQAAGGEVRYTEYPGVGHACWDLVYGNPEVTAFLVGGDPAARFYEAFYLDRGEQRAEPALELYLRFLQAAPRHRLAGHAARFAIRLLRRLDRQDEAERLARRYAAVLAETVPVGINATFEDPGVDVARLTQRFESESREVFKHRNEIVELIGLRAGQAVADIGAGTGFFSNLFARAVGSRGKVYAVELGPKLVEHLRELAHAMNLPWMEAVQSTHTSTNLPPESIDVAFVCDTYHHFENWRAMLASIHRALRPGGQLVLIEFHRIPGKSRQWLLDHVRAGQETFTREIEQAGFRLIRQEPAAFLHDNYMLRFEKTPK